MLEHLLVDALAEFVTVNDADLSERMLWVVRRLERFRGLVTVVHSRTAVSRRVDNWHNGFHRLVEDMLADGLRQAGIAEAEVSATTTIGVFVVEGLLTHPQDEAGKRAVIELVTAKNLSRPAPGR